MPAPDHSLRLAIAGAASLRGKELKQLLEAGRFSAADFRLIDDEAVGVLTEAGGEATFVQALEEESFHHARFAFFAGDAATTARAWPRAQRAGATVIDLTGSLAGVPAAAPWIPSLDSILPPPQPSVEKLFSSPGAAAIIACSVAAALRTLPVRHLVINFLQPASECGQRGVDELESQTVNLLSFQPVPQELYDAQVAFNLLARYGSASRVNLGDVRADLRREVHRYLAGRAPLPAIQLIQAPVFYSLAFSAFVELESAAPVEELQRTLAGAGLAVGGADEPPLSNVSVAGESRIALARAEPDGHVAHGWWLWGAGDNVRLAAANAVAIAEKLLAW